MLVCACGFGVGGLGSVGPTWRGVGQWWFGLRGWWVGVGRS